MDELVDELSSAMIDVDNCGVNSTSNDCNIDIDINSIDKCMDCSKDSQSRPQKNHKPVARTASILIRSKLLILSDSESDEETNSGINSKMSQLSARKGKRVNKKLTHLNNSLSSNQTHPNHKLPLQMQFNSSPYTGKRKRSSTISEATQASGTNTTSNGNQMECDSSTSSLSETSDDYDSDNNFDGDDEQSDFYEVIAKTNKTNSRQRHHNHSHGARPIDFAVPSTRNPFLTMGLSSSSTSSYNSSLSSANMLWKRRRRMH